MKTNNHTYDSTVRRPWTGDLTGQRFNHFVVEGLLYVHRKKGNVWLCVCDCGKKFRADPFRIKNVLQSCGCVKNTVFTHKMSRDNRLYRIWGAMKTRCLNPKAVQYKGYGGRGITVCQEWKDDFMCFYTDMKDGYSDDLQLDRIDNDGGYCKSNCKWSTQAEQAKNKTKTVWFEANGMRMIKEDWARHLGVRSTKFNNFLNKGYTFEQVVFHYHNKRKFSRIKETFKNE